MLDFCTQKINIFRIRSIFDKNDKIAKKLKIFFQRVKMGAFLTNFYGCVAESHGFFDSWITKNTIRSQNITPIEMKILYGLRYGNLKTPGDFVKYYGIPDSTVHTVVSRLIDRKLIRQNIISHKNRPLILEPNGEEIIDEIFTKLETEYKKLVKQMLVAEDLERQKRNNIKPNKRKSNISDEDVNTEYSATIFKSLKLTNERFIKYLPHRNKKI